MKKFLPSFLSAILIFFPNIAFAEVYNVSGILEKSQGDRFTPQDFNSIIETTKNIERDDLENGDDSDDVFRIQGGKIIFPAPSVEPENTSIDDGEWTLWIDETTGEIKIKGKKRSDGTIIDATIGSGGGGGALEADPLFSASDVAGITAADIQRWNDAYGWGDFHLGTLSDLSNADDSARQDGYILKWNQASGFWEAVPEGVASINISSLVDVDVSSVLDGQILYWNGVSQKWETTDNSDTEDDLSDNVLRDLSNVDDSTRQDGYILRWNQASGIWEASLENSSVNTLSALTDVNVGSKTDGQILRWNEIAQQWQASDDNSRADDLSDNSLGELQNVDVSGISSGDFLKWDGNTFVPETFTVDRFELDDVFSSNGILMRTGPGTYSVLSNNSTNWDESYSWGNHSDVGYLTSASLSSYYTKSELQTPSSSQIDWANIINAPSSFINGFSYAEIENEVGVYMQYAPNDVPCVENQILVYKSGIGWKCGDNIDTDTTLTATEVDDIVSDNGYLTSEIGDISQISTRLGSCDDGDCDLTTIDGSGSEIDADTIDGLDSSDFLFGAGGNNGQIQFNNNGDLSGIPSFIWDTNSNRFGMGISTPESFFHTHENSGDGIFFQMTNNDTGNTSQDGLKVGVDSNESAVISSESDIRLQTGDGTSRMIIDAQGKIGIGSISPNASLDVSGDGFFLPLSGAEPIDADLKNRQWTLWIDEANEQFYLKGKRADGLVTRRALVSKHDLQTAGNVDVYWENLANIPADFADGIDNTGDDTLDDIRDDNLEDLQNVNTASVASGQILGYNGSEWEPVPYPVADNLGDHIATIDFDLNNNALLDVDWVNSDDGSGSELDADLLDGQDGSFYLNWNAFQNVPNFNSLSTATLSCENGEIAKWSENSNAWECAEDGGGSGSGNSWDYIAIQNIDMDANGIVNIDWSASDDGDGSGLDADLLDGLHGNDYVKWTDTGTAIGNIPVVEATGKLNSNILPAITFTDVYAVADNAARDSFTPKQGDVAIVANSDGGQSRSFVYDGSTWIELETPTGMVQSVNGQAGIVQLNADHIDPGTTNMYYTLSQFNADFDNRINDSGTAVTDVWSASKIQSELSAVNANLSDYYTKTELQTGGSAVVDINNISGLGTAADKDIGIGNGEIPVLGVNGKLNASVLPAIAITDVYTVTDAADLNSLTVETGDVGISTNDNKSYIYDGLVWKELKTPTSQVISVNGEVGAVELNTDDVLEGANLYYTQNRFDTAFGNKSLSDLGTKSHDNLTDIGIHSHDDIDAHINNTSIHAPLNDTQATINNVWSASKIDAVIQALDTSADDLSDNILSQIGDVNVAGITSDSILKWDAINTEWVAAPNIVVESDPNVNALGKSTLDCSLNEIARFNGTTWVCSTDEDTVLDETAVDSFVSDNGYITNAEETDPVFMAWDKQTGISISESQISDFQDYLLDSEVNALAKENLNCNASETVKWNGNNWECSGSVGGAKIMNELLDVDTTSTPPSSGNVLKWNGGKWTPSPDVGGDNLGNHIATKNINLSDNALLNVDWSASDDGSGSQLDADLLDGKNGSYYLDWGNITNITLGSAAYRDIGESSGQIPIIDASGKLDQDILPALAISNVYVTASIAARNLLSPIQTGDVCIVTDAGAGEPKSYIYNGGSWVEILVPNSQVSTVNNESGTVILDTDDIPEGSINKYYSSLLFDADFSGKIQDAMVGADIIWSSDKIQTEINAVASGGGDLSGYYTKTDLQTSGSAQVHIENISGAGTAALKNVGILEGDVPVLGINGKLNTSVVPSIAITDVYPVADIPARDALSVAIGDVAIVATENKSYIFDGTTWQELITPTNQVSSVNSLTGNVSLTTDNIPQGSANEYYSSSLFDADFTQKNLADLNDIDISGIDDGYVLKWDATNNKWIVGDSINGETDPVFTAWNKSDGISITESQISDLQNYLLDTDVNALGKATLACANDEIAKFNGTIWECSSDIVLDETAVDSFVSNNGYITNAEETDPTVLASVKDGVDYSEILNGNSGDGIFMNYKPDGNRCAAGQLLKYNNIDDRWECGADEEDLSNNSITDLSNVNAATPADGQILIWSDANSQWESQNPPSGADDLGNHTATQNILTNGNWLSNDGDSEGVFVDVDGNIGVGISSPNALLHLKTDTGTNAELNIQTATNAHWGIYQDETTADLRFWNISNKFVITDNGKVGIGTENVAPITTLDVNGGISFNVQTTTGATYTATSEDYMILCDAGSAEVTVTLPPAANTGQELTIKKIDVSTNNCVLNTSGADTIDSQSDISWNTQHESYTVISDGMNWWIK